MKEIKLEGLNETIFLHTHKSGLKTFMWVNEKVNSTYMTLSVKYGSIHTEFKVGNKKYKVPNGVAHFLEHVKFNEREDYTAHDYFYKSGGSSNAFTTFNYTSYLVFTTVNFKDNLNHLIDFVYNPFFTKKTIQKEKGIIVEEANMGSDDPYSLSYYLMFKNMFHESNYKEFITGTPEEIKKITLDDVVNVYNSFYHPENMFLCITGNFNPYEAAKIIDENLDQKEFAEYIPPVIVKKKEPKEVVKKYDEVELNVTLPKVKIGLKIPRSKFKEIDDLTLRFILNVILNCNLGGASDFRDELLTKGLITAIGYAADIVDDYVAIVVTAETLYPDEVIKRIEEKLENLTISEKVVERKKKVNIATLILDFDDIESVNSMICDNLINYDDLLPDIKTRYKEISYDMFLETIKKIDTTNKSILVIKEKTDKN